MIDLPTDLPADLAPLSWLIGIWEGTGVIDYDTADRHFTGSFAHRVSFSHDGGDYLNYSANAWLIGDGSGGSEDSDDSADDERRTPLVAEIGFWRLVRPSLDGDAGPGLLPAPGTSPTRTVDDVESLRTPQGGFDIEAAIVHSDGVSELYLGQISGPRIDIATDAVVRPAQARAYAAATRMYGLVDGHLLWAWDVAALGHELASHASARLARVD